MQQNALFLAKATPSFLPSFLQGGNCSKGHPR